MSEQDLKGWLILAVATLIACAYFYRPRRWKPTGSASWNIIMGFSA